MRVVYCGPFPGGVDVYLPDGSVPTAKPGEALEVPDEVGRELIDRGEFAEEAADKKVAKKSAT